MRIKTDAANRNLLELKEETGGYRYYLSGEPVHAGDFLELLLDDGSWILGRYEWNYRPAEFPWFYVDTEAEDIMDLDSALSRLRWPGRET